MKKFALGLAVGIALTLSVSTYAEEIESYIGKTIEGQFPVLVDGNRADRPGIVVEGTTYLPVRSVGGLFGYDVAFIDSQVILSKKEVNHMSEIVNPKEKEDVKSDMSLSSVETEIEIETVFIDRTVAWIDRLQKEGDKEKVKELQATLQERKQRLSELMDIKTMKEAELTETP